MCGIYGKIGDYILNSSFVDSIKFLRNRGPDERGTYMSKNVLLGHTRLVIIDKKGGRQPMTNNNLAITFNGEIFNHEELRAELKKLGHTFNGRCDTEVLLPLYKEYGVKMLEKLDGQFAFAITDGKKLFIARDRFGILPLYYHKDPFVFSSDISLLAKNFVPELNTEMFSTFLKYRHIPGEETLYKGIYKLLPGHYMIVNDKKVKIKQYYDVPILKNKKPVKENIKKVKSAVSESVKARLMADVPVGTFLSGGLDSGIITKAAQEGLPARSIRSFATGFRDNNEKSEAKETARRCYTYHRWVRFDKEEYYIHLHDLIKNKMYPMQVPNEVLIKNLAKEAKGSGIKVLLSGEGADEIFCGYDNLFKVAQSKGYKHAIDKYGYFDNDKLKDIFGVDVVVPNIKKQGTDIQTFSKFMVKNHLPCLLNRLDFATMENSVESRPPFVSRRVIELALSLPDKQKLDKGVSKIALREAFRGELPDKIIDRIKIPFPSVVDMKGDLKRLIKIYNLTEDFPNIKKALTLKPKQIMFIYSFFVWYTNYKKFVEEAVEDEI